MCVLHPLKPLFLPHPPFFADVTRAQTVPSGNAGGKVLIGMKDLKRMCGVCGWVEEDGFIAFGSAPTTGPPSSFRVQGAAVESSRDRGAFTFMSFFSSSFEIILAPLPNQTHWATWHGLSRPQLLAKRKPPRNCRRRQRRRRRRTH